MTEQFTVEEENLMCIFDISSRDSIISSLSGAMEYFEDDMIGIAESSLVKLNKMTDEEFNELEFYPVE